MKNVLIVDDEKSFLQSLVEGLIVYAADFNTLTAENGRRAAEILAATHVDLVVTDLKMPEMDGFELLAHLLRNYPSTPAVVMTAYCTPEIKARLEGMGSFKILEKPIDLKELVDVIFAELAAASRGYIYGITLPAFLQLVEMERKSCTLKIESRGKTGFLHFSDGLLHEAETGTESGERAAFDIVGWDEPEIEIKNVRRDLQRAIHSPLTYILMEGFRIKDELRRSGEPAAGVLLTEETAASLDADASNMQSGETEDAPYEAGVNAEDEKEGTMADLKEILNEFTKLQGVDAVCLVGRDGFLLDSIARTGIDSEMIGAIASSGFGASESMGKQLGKGEMSLSMIEFDKGPVMFSPVGEDAFIVIIAGKDSNLGMIRLKLKKHSHELATAAAF